VRILVVVLHACVSQGPLEYELLTMLSHSRCPEKSVPIADYKYNEPIDPGTYWDHDALRTDRNLELNGVRDESRPTILVSE